MAANEYGDPRLSSFGWFDPLASIGGWYSTGWTDIPNPDATITAVVVQAVATPIRPAFNASITATPITATPGYLNFTFDSTIEGAHADPYITSYHVLSWTGTQGHTQAGAVLAEHTASYSMYVAFLPVGAASYADWSQVSYGQSYPITLWAKGRDFGVSFQCWVREYDSSGTQLSVVTLTTGTLSTSSWTSLGGTYTPSSSNVRYAYVTVIITGLNPYDNWGFYFDDFSGFGASATTIPAPRIMPGPASVSAVATLPTPTVTIASAIDLRTPSTISFINYSYVDDPMGYAQTGVPTGTQVGDLLISTGSGNMGSNFDGSWQLAGVSGLLWKIATSGDLSASWNFGDDTFNAIIAMFTYRGTASTPFGASARGSVSTGPYVAPSVNATLATDVWLAFFTLNGGSATAGSTGFTMDAIPGVYGMAHKQLSAAGPTGTASFPSVGGFNGSADSITIGTAGAGGLSIRVAATAAVPAPTVSASSTVTPATVAARGDSYTNYMDVNSGYNYGNATAALGGQANAYAGTNCIALTHTSATTMSLNSPINFAAAVFVSRPSDIFRVSAMVKAAQASPGVTYQAQVGSYNAGATFLGDVNAGSPVSASTDYQEVTGKAASPATSWAYRMDLAFAGLVNNDSKVFYVDNVTISAPPVIRPTIQTSSTVIAVSVTATTTVPLPTVVTVTHATVTAVLVTAVAAVPDARPAINVVAVAATAALTGSTVSPGPTTVSAIAAQARPGLPATVTAAQVVALSAIALPQSPATITATAVLAVSAITTERPAINVVAVTAVTAITRPQSPATVTATQVPAVSAVIRPAFHASVTGLTAALSVSALPAATASASSLVTATVTISTAAAPAAAVHLYKMGTYKPNILYTLTNLTGAYTDIDDSPDTPDANALVPTGGAIVVRMGFENHSSNMRTEVGDQKFRVVVKVP